MEIETILDKILKLPATSLYNLTNAITIVQYPKGHRLLNADKVERNIYFIKEGIARAYTHSSDHETTFWLGKEGDTVLSMRSYVDNHKGYENIDLLEDSILYKKNIATLNRLFTEDIYSKLGTKICRTGASSNRRKTYPKTV